MSDESVTTQEVEEARPPSEREQLVARVSAGNASLIQTIQSIQRDLLRMDEIGCGVSRCRTRIDKVEAVRHDWWAHFDYDILKGNNPGTREQKARAERHELS